MSGVYIGGVMIRVEPEGPWEPSSCVWIPTPACAARSKRCQLYTADHNYMGWRGGITITGQSGQATWRRAFMRHQQDDGPVFRSPGKARRWVEQMTLTLSTIGHNWDDALTMDLLQDAFRQAHGADMAEVARLAWDSGV